MNNEKRQGISKVIVNIFNEEYVVRGTEDPEYIQMLASYVDRKMQAIHQKNPGLGTNRLAVLTALNLVDELSKLQEDYDQLLKRLEEARGNRPT
ncbi:MAG: cell division protein ZapA [Chitinophagales bacterium]